MMSNQCISCERYRLAQKCDAFPAGIPEPITLGQHDHTEPYEGDGGLLFTELRRDEVTKA